MGILGRLFRRSRENAAPAATAPMVSLLEGDVDLPVVGESFYQEALWEIVRVRRGEPVRQAAIAVLVPEPQNPHDPNAIRVDISGKQVGHLSAANAVRYGSGLRMLMEQHRGYIALNAVVVGGGHGRENLGVWLSHNPSHFGLAVSAPRPAPEPAAVPRSIRTGFSEAWVTDAGDDSYDLSWYSQLPEGAAAATLRLRQLLSVDPDPIDRHYMFTELENRLYRLGAHDETWMSEFDTVCLAHHEEMASIVSAFLAKWEVVPLLNTYRQMSIRQQKARDWSSSLWWAERGIEMYGANAARSEWVLDLEGRRNRAIAKIDQLAQPPRSRPARKRSVEDQSVPSEQENLEVLTCQNCGTDFERVRTRGRKPLMCANCR